MILAKLLLAAALPALVGLAWASPAARVDAVQMPAWRDRDGETRPLAVGMEIRNGDRLRTGAAARAYLKLGEGSTVKLGQGATLVFYSRSLRPERRFTGALDVLGGAFRFTTGAVNRLGGNRELDIRVGVVTAGIRGTDVWGRSNDEGDLVCLIEGHIQLSHGGQTQPMDGAQSYVMVPKGAAALPVAPVDPAQLKRWARETEVLAGDGAVRRGGRWKLLLGSPEDEAQALALYDRARAAGYAAEIRPSDAGGKWSYQVLIAHLASAQEAGVLESRLRADVGVEARVTR